MTTPPPANVIDLINKVVRTSRDMRHATDREPTAAELAETLALPVAHVQRLLELAKTPIHLNP